MQFETVIGLETHVQLNTRSKAFCADNTQFGAAPNTQVSAISLAHPGTMPRFNRAALNKAIRLGIALGSQIAECTAFDRKNYFYADLPKGFQTTQDNLPVCIGGTLNGIRIHHMHLEEDAGKSIHDQRPDTSLIDLNRAGVPLLEIVSEPDLRSAEEVATYMETLRRLVRWLDISDGNMEEGSLRCDVNISVRPVGQQAYGQRCEIKNVNSMRFAKRAIEFEVQRQIDLIKSGGAVEQETRGFDANTGKTYSLREKENAHDYRYFPEPDLPPIRIKATDVASIQAAMPVLPDVLERRFQEEMSLLPADATLLASERDIADYFLQMVDKSAGKITPKAIANLLIHKLLPWSNSTGKNLNDCPVSIESWLELLTLIETSQVSSTAAYQTLFPAMLTKSDQPAAVLAHELNLIQSSDTDYLGQLADEVLAKMPDKVAEYRKGKKGLIGLFMGELMKASRGKADPKEATRILTEKLG